jgi:hypothetical protein
MMMKVYQLLPRDFPEMNMIEQIDSLIDVYEILMRISGNKQFKDNIEMLELVKSESLKRNLNVNVFELMGDDFTKEDFRKMKMEMYA